VDVSLLIIYKLEPRGTYACSDMGIFPRALTVGGLKVQGDTTLFL